MLAKLQAWFEAKDWRTWVSHVFMAALVGLVGWAVVLMPTSALERGMLLGVLAYWWREIEQVWTQYRTGGSDAVLAHAGDHFMDLAAPFIAFVVWAALR